MINQEYNSKLGSLNTAAPHYTHTKKIKIKKTLINVKSQINLSTIGVGGINILFSPADRHSNKN